MRYWALSSYGQRQSWAEFSDVLHRPRVRIGLIAWVVAGIACGLLVAVIDLDAQAVYAIGLATLATLGGIVVYLRTQRTRWMAQLDREETAKAFNAALAEQSQVLSELKRSIAEFRPVEFQPEAIRWLLAQRIHPLTEREQATEAEHSRGTQLLARLQEGSAAQQFRKDLQGLLRRYEEVDLPEAERVAWLQFLGLYLYEAGLDEINRVEQIDVP